MIHLEKGVHAPGKENEGLLLIGRRLQSTYVFFNKEEELKRMPCILLCPLSPSVEGLMRKMEIFTSSDRKSVV